MKKRFIWLLSAAVFASLLRFCPPLRAFWAAHIAPVPLGIAAKIGGLIPFSILESGLILCVFTWALRLYFDLSRKGFASACVRLFKSLLSLALAVLTAYLAVWYPLCLSQNNSAFSANTRQLEVSCRRLICDLNAVDPDFSDMRLPAKYALFPAWMDFLNISGFCSFFTGEALISPRLDPASAPFTAVHERAHLRGIAHEGEANIEAYRQCMALGESWAYSARLWALKYTLGILKESDARAYFSCREEMNARTARNLRNIGGDNLPKRTGSGAIYAFSGIGFAVSEYEVLAYYLAAAYAQ